MKRVWRWLLLATAFAAGIFVTAGMIGAVTPEARVPEFSDKLAHVAAQSDQYDVLFLGSSRVRRQISPEVFDGAMAELGAPMRSYNFGLDGLGFPEILYVADRIFATKPRRLKYVFVELTRFSREFGPLSQPDSRRTIYWHTPRLTAGICRAVWEDPALPPACDRLSLIGEHLQIMLKRSLNLGRGAELVEEGGRSAMPNLKVGPKGDGFFPVHDRLPEQRRAEYEQQVAGLPALLDKPPTTEVLFEEMTMELMDTIERAGVIPVVMTMPRVHPGAPWLPAIPAGSKRMELRFDDPRLEPTLFDVGMHYDAQHLNAEGAKVFSRRLAERFVERLHRERP